MSTDRDRADLRERVETFAANNPAASVMDVLGGLALDPEHRPLVEAVLSGEDEAADSSDTPRETTTEPRSGDVKGGCGTEGPGSISAGAFGPIDDAEFDGSTEAVREHYRRIGPVLGVLESVGEYPTNALTGNSGWYQYTDATELDREAFDAGYRSFRRTYTIGHDREELLDSIEFDPNEDSWRSLYAITSYKDPEALDAGAYSMERRGGFDSGEGLSEYADIRALPIWIDVDLADDRDDALDPDDETEYGTDLKARRGDLDPRELQLVERALDLIVTEVADIYDKPPERIAAYDSGGGFYPFGPAAATIPIAERYDHEARERLFVELRDRINAYVAGDADTPGTVDAYGFEGIIPRVERKVPGAKYLLDTDALWNKNRQSKAPGSIHKTHDVVVTPLRDADGIVDYTPTTVSEFAANDDLLDRTVAETRKFTDDTPEARACVEPLVATLFPEYADREDCEGWTDTLDAWLTDDWRRERARIHATARDDLRRRERRAERREELAAELDHEPTDDEVSAALADQQVTTVRQDVFDDLDRIDVGEVIRKFASDEWDTSNRGHETTFDPAWRASGSGMSCAVPNGGDTFIDNSCNGGGGPAKAYALGTGIIPGGDTAAATPLRGRKWGEAVDGLRGEGYDIRVYIPETDEEYDETPLWALRKAAVALDVCGPDEFKEHETDDGETYLGFDRETFNDVLDALDDAGVDHGREHIDAGVSGGQQYEPQQCAPPAVETEPFDRDEYRATLRNERYRMWLERKRQTTIWGDDAGTGKTTNAGLGAFERDRPQFAAFDKHVKAHEFIHDPATPDDWMHLKGTGQPRYDCCMDAQAAAGPDETPHCPEHGHPADWPRMCPVKELDIDDSRRIRYDALADGLGEKVAHLTMGLWTPDEHEWHPPDAPWGAQFDALTDENGDVGVPRVAGVHEYQMLETATRGRDLIVDESPRVLASDEAVPVDKLLKAAVRLGELAAVHDSDSDHPHLGDNLEAIGAFADDLAHELSRGKLETRALADDGLEAPDLTGETIHVEVDPDSGDLPADIDPETVEYHEEETRREYDGLSRNYREYTVQNEGYVGERELLAEAVAQVKLTYNESVRKRLKNDEWSGEPFCIDDLLAAAIEAGPDRLTRPLRQAIAIDPVLRDCPWCGHELDAAHGARVCRDCGWDERQNTVTRKDGPEARITAWLETHSRKIPGDEIDPSLVSKRLPLADDLPDPLVLDATATPEKIAALYGESVDDVPVEGTTPLDLDGKVRTVQVVGGRHPNDPSESYHIGGQYHAKTIEDSPKLRERIQNTITHVCDVHHRPLFGIRRKLIELFEWPDNAEVLHYGGARGLNKDECDAVCCIGAPHPDMDDIQRLADTLAQGRDDVRAGGREFGTRRNEDGELDAEPPVYRKLLYEDANGDGLAVPTKAYSGLVGALFREAREKELEQFIHRIRPLLVGDDEPMKHAYLLTDVPTDLPIDEVVGFEELADPLEAFLPVPEGGVELIEAIADVAAGNGPDGFRADQLIETRENGEVANNRRGLTQLTKLAGVTVTYDGDDHAPSYDTVSGWVDRLEDLGLLVPEDYEERAGMTYAADTTTLESALEVVSSSAFSEVAAVRRFAAEVRASMGSLDWLRWAREAFDLGGERTGVKPPPNRGG